MSHEDEWKAAGCFSGFLLWPFQWCICLLRYFTHNVVPPLPLFFLWGLGGRHWQVLQSSFVAQPKKAPATLDKAAGYHTNLHALLLCWKAHRICQHGSALPEAPKKKSQLNFSVTFFSYIFIDWLVDSEWPVQVPESRCSEVWKIYTSLLSHLF